MKGMILLGGGGEVKDEILIFKTLASWVGPVGKLLFWPIAHTDPRSYDSCLVWFTETFTPLGVKNITMWSDLEEHQAPELDNFEAIFIGGGNAYWLLAQLIKSGFNTHLVQYVENGGMVYGGSAGAVVLGRDIQTVSHLDRNEINLRERCCLDLAAGHAVWVHYQKEDDKLIYKYGREQNHPVIAISERSGVLVDVSGMQAIGYEPAFVFDESGKHEISFKMRR
jgi:dipeptidase E